MALSMDSLTLAEPQPRGEADLLWGSSMPGFRAARDAGAVLQAVFTTGQAELGRPAARQGHQF